MLLVLPKLCQSSRLTAALGRPRLPHHDQWPAAIRGDENRGGGRLAQLHARSRLSQADRQVASGYEALVQLADLLDLPQNIRVSIL